MDRLPLPDHRRLRRLLPACAVALSLAGCGITHAAPNNPAPTATTTSSTTTTTTTDTTGSTGTGTTPSLPGSGRPVVTIGDKNYAEQFVLGQLYLRALEAQGFKVNITENIGPPSVVRQALKDGSLAMYPEYLDVLDQTFAHRQRSYPTFARALQVARRWAEAHQLRLLTPTSFGDTDAIAVTDSYADQHRLKSLGDLLGVAGSLVVGGAAQFKTERVGLPSLASGYGVEPETFVSLAVGAQYDQLDSGAIQAAYVNTTDGELTTGDYRVLADPARIFGFGNIVPVISRKAMSEEGPAFAATIERVNRSLSLTTMRQLNYAVSIAKQAPAAVALQYLQARGLLAPLTASDY